MRLWHGFFALGVLAAALWPGVAQASFGSDVFRAAFNEGPSDSPPPLIFTIRIPQTQTVVFTPSSVSLPVLERQVFLKAPQFVPQAADETIASVPTTVQIAPQPATVQYYQAATPLSTDPPTASRFQIQGRFDASQAPQSFTGMDQQALSAGATIDARVGKRTVGVDLSRSLAHYANTDPASNVGFSNDMVPAYIPPFADISKDSLSAGFNVPVSRRMTANLSVEGQHFVGSVVPFDAYNTIYGVGLTYKMKGPAAISLVTKQYRYQDNLLPLNNLTQTSTNLTFSVKF